MRAFTAAVLHSSSSLFERSCIYLFVIKRGTESALSGQKTKKPKNQQLEQMLELRQQEIQINIDTALQDTFLICGEMQHRHNSDDWDQKNKARNRKSRHLQYIFPSFSLFFPRCFVPSILNNRFKSSACCTSSVFLPAAAGEAFWSWPATACTAVQRPRCRTADPFLLDMIH